MRCREHDVIHHKNSLIIIARIWYQGRDLEGLLSRDDTHCDAIKPDKRTENWKFQRISFMFSEDKGTYNYNYIIHILRTVYVF